MDRKIKTYKGEWYTVNSIFGNDWARFFYLLGGREAGKSYSVMRWAVNRKIKKGEHFKFYWMRLTDSSADKLLASNGKDLIDPDLKRKYNVNLIRKGDTLYSYDEVVRINKNGKEVVEKKNMKEFCRVLSFSTFYNNKGQALYDNEFLRNPENEIFIVLDEMNREQSEKKSFDIVYNFVNQIENVIRSEKQNIKIVMIGNTLEEASDLLSAINFIPDSFGRYKLKSKHAVVDYIKPNEEYLRRRKDTVADIFTPNASTFTNEIQIDRTLLVNKRKAIRPINPINEDLSLMRTTLVPSMLNAISRNQKKGNLEGRLFEIAKIFIPKELPLTDYPDERDTLCVGVFGQNEDFFTLKGIAETVADTFLLDFEYEEAEKSFLHPYQTAVIKCEGEEIGYLGKLAYDIADKLDLRNDAYVMQIDLAKLAKWNDKKAVFKPLPKFAEESRDLALVMTKDITCKQVEDVIGQSCNYIKNIRLFDVYE